MANLVTETQRLTDVCRSAAETIGTAFLLTTVIGSGIMKGPLAGGNATLAFLANTIATGTASVVLVLTFGSISDAHFNPAGTPAGASRHGLAWREVPAYLAGQLLGALAGVAATPGTKFDLTSEREIDHSLGLAIPAAYSG